MRDEKGEKNIIKRKDWNIQTYDWRGRVKRRNTMIEQREIDEVASLPTYHLWKTQIIFKETTNLTYPEKKIGIS